MSIVRKSHGMTLTKEYCAWTSMKRRCLDPQRDSYSRYGGRGIKVCDRWLNSFENFFEDMGYAPSKEHSIERIDVNSGYYPKNCKWATSFEQSNNRRSNKRYLYKGEKLTIRQISDLTGVSYLLLKDRLRWQWPLEKAIETPSVTAKQYEIDGTRKTISEWAEMVGLKRDTIVARLKRGWTIKDALAPLKQDRLK